MGRKEDSMKELKIDREFQALIPPLSDEEFRQLETTVLKDGCRDALVTSTNCRKAIRT